MIAGLIEPTRGTIRIQGRDMNGIPPHKRDISMVFQNYALFPHLSVYENIVYGLKTRKIKDKKVLMEKAREMMNLVQLEGVENRLPKELSGGQQQRVSLARAMIVEPKVMLKKMNVTAIYVTHDQEEALTISDRIAVMNKGRIEQITEPSSLYTRPATRFIAGFVGHANIVEGSVTKATEDRFAVKLTSGEEIWAKADPVKKASAGDGAVLIIRPENIRLHDEKPDKSNILSGTVKAKIYLGSTLRYVIEMAGNNDFEVDLHTKDEGRAVEGDMIYLELDENGLILVER